MTIRIKVASWVSDPPTTISAADLARIQQASERLHAAFAERTARMEILSADDLRVRVK